MGRKSEMALLVDQIEASDQAHERAKTILKTLGGDYSVQKGCRALGVGRTRFQDLRRRMLAAAVSALEERASGRPRVEVAKTCRQLSALRRKTYDLEKELRRTLTELEIARSEAGPAVQRRLLVRGVQR